MTNSNLFQCIATCPDETKHILAKELETLGAVNIREKYRSVYFDCSEKVFYELHLKLRSASKIFKVIKEFPAKDWQMLFDQARRIKWPDLFDSRHTFKVDGVQTGRGPGYMSSNDISKRVREALQGVYERTDGTKPVVELQDPKIVINAYMEKGRCTLSFDTAGKTMHKRGYKLEGHPAPLKETLAASILMQLGYNGSQVLYDPMCGSGTFIVEGAFMALNKAPLIHRGKGEFGFEWLKGFNKDLWRKVQDEARAEKSDALPQPIYASDISPEFVELAKKNALRARVEKYIQFNSGDFFAIEPPRTPGILVMNLPYGERLKKESNEEKFIEFYKQIGDQLKRHYKGWTAAILAAKESPYKFIGLKPRRKIDLMNGSIPVKLLIFEMY